MNPQNSLFFLAQLLISLEVSAYLVPYSTPKYFSLEVSCTDNPSLSHQFVTIAEDGQVGIGQSIRQKLIVSLNDDKQLVTTDSDGEQVYVTCRIKDDVYGGGYAFRLEKEKPDNAVQAQFSIQSPNGEGKHLYVEIPEDQNDYKNGWNACDNSPVKGYNLGFGIDTDKETRCTKLDSLLIVPETEISYPPQISSYHGDDDDSDIDDYDSDNEDYDSDNEDTDSDDYGSDDDKTDADGRSSDCDEEFDDNDDNGDDDKTYNPDSSGSYSPHPSKFKSHPSNTYRN